MWGLILKIEKYYINLRKNIPLLVKYTAMDKWYIKYNGVQIGPMTREQLLSYNPTPDTMVLREGYPQWVPLYTFPELMELISHNQSYYEGAVEPTSGKDHIGAGVMAILLGCLGAQYFYVGKVAGGFITILLCLVTCGLWDILMLVQGILMICMTQQEFDRKYVYSNSTLPLF